MFFLIKVLLLPIWLPFRIFLEIAKHSGRRTHACGSLVIDLGVPRLE